MCPNVSYSYLSATTTAAYSIDCDGQDKDDDGYTAYGACKDKSTGDAVCAFTSKDCDTGEVFKDPFVTSETLGLDCSCYNVQTGACYDTTSHTSTCAFSEESCADGEVWISARDSEASYSLGCRACSLIPTASPTSTTPVTATPTGDYGVKAEYGGCYSMSTHQVTCAFNQSACGSDTWMTPDDLDGYSMSCDLVDIEVGSCYDATDTHVATCALDSSNCPNSSYYWISAGYEFSDGHTCNALKNREDGWTAYGACYDGSTAICSFGAADCGTGESFVNPWKTANALGLDCSCHYVHTGACYDVTSHTTTCTYSKESCADGETWLSARTAETYNLGCRACTRNATYSPSASPMEYITVAPTTAPTEMTCESTCSAYGTEEKIIGCGHWYTSEGSWCDYGPGQCCKSGDSERCCKPDGLKIGGLVIGIIIVLALVVGLCIVTIKSQKSKTKNAEYAEAQAVEVVRFTKEDGETELVGVSLDQ
eukprot:CAMPEP_0185769912 /NCGR_PEP_ID=MMETSP1174-20130828/56539_1 /TAXON_ID=35687 /ORGANISM="Dictyocha speculum, Strain CCMP1381" /LENGTH=480 /DNA_ID=CAMNT_0028455153 /DNA_START=388 /DNA_END=1830 /DNA_ORIENTATION=-